MTARTELLVAELGVDVMSPNANGWSTVHVAFGAAALRARVIGRARSVVSARVASASVTIGRPAHSATSSTCST